MRKIKENTEENHLLHQLWLNASRASRQQSLPVICLSKPAKPLWLFLSLTIKGLMWANNRALQSEPDTPYHAQDYSFDWRSWKQRLRFPSLLNRVEISSGTSPWHQTFWKKAIARLAFTSISTNMNIKTRIFQSFVLMLSSKKCGSDADYCGHQLAWWRNLKWLKNKGSVYCNLLLMHCRFSVTDRGV